MKKLVSLGLAAIVVASMSISAFAAESEIVETDSTVVSEVEESASVDPFMAVPYQVIRSQMGYENSYLSVPLNNIYTSGICIIDPVCDEEGVRGERWDKESLISNITLEVKDTEVFLTITADGEDYLSVIDINSIEVEDVNWNGARYCSTRLYVGEYGNLWCYKSNESNSTVSSYFTGAGIPFEIDGKQYSVEIANSTSKLYHYFNVYDLKATSDKGYYDIVINDGDPYYDNTHSFAVSDLKVGENKLTAAQIKDFNVSITGTNKATGAVRVMDQNTIEEITLTVTDFGSYKQITHIKVRGRAQVGVGGKLDRYTAEANIEYYI